MNSKLDIMLVALAGFCAWTAPVRAQNTFIYAPVPPATKLEMFETNTGTVLIKSAAVIGSMAINGGSVSVTCKEDAEPATGRKEYGIIIALATEQMPLSSPWPWSRRLRRKTGRWWIMRSWIRCSKRSMPWPRSIGP
ncbi:MAG: hypothetical protein NTW03_01120 [Verrucomicrobia bacterium]|nr:hypothetical protein [Verrucomicrobiota bacterium]